ncbi:DUF1173 family protein [Burkholderia sp. Ac-20353]|uniref:DUF1173 family protein n=1 Tax=Burkholderia sp. Ac-20353 TaxID=2703894 RepID=UPI00197C2F28|nr:DUF1173 family protein [Burkholderia sp. Ac-20353]MBN3785677.1 DUF1173 domain-containing protein [Burkholderia sp. Ac-20353]
MPSVSFAGHTTLLEDLQENPARYARQLERAKITPGFAQCRCHEDRPPLKLVIRRYGTLFHLAGWPDEGPLHRRDCDFHKTARPTGSHAGKSLPGITATPDGLRARLDVALEQRTIVPASKGTPRVAPGKVSRRAAPLLGFTHALWEAGDLNRWSGVGTHRNWGACNAQILAGIGDSVINGQPADEVLHIMRRFQEADRDAINAEFDAFLARVAAHNGANRRGIVVGEVAEVGTTQFGRAITLRQSAKRYYAGNALIARVEQKYAHAWRAIGDREAKVIACLVIERSTNGKHHVAVDLAAMLCSASFITCDSIHEVAMANRLVSERRMFEKPIRCRDGDAMLPDFILTDVVPATHIEMYGMNGMPEYEARKAKKRAIRVRDGIPVVEWNIEDPLTSVLLPPPAPRRPGRDR